MFRRKKVRDATFYGITVPAMAGMYGALFEAIMHDHSFPAALFGSGLVVLVFGIVFRITALLQLGRAFSTKEERFMAGDQVVRVEKHSHRVVDCVPIPGPGMPPAPLPPPLLPPPPPMPH
jgi:hypothetical protein